LQIGGSSCIVDNLFAVQPATNHAVSLRSETHLKAQVEPFAAKISLLLVEDDELVVEILCDSENAADAGVEVIMRPQLDAKRPTTGPNDAGFYCGGPSNQTGRVLEIAKGRALKAVVDVDWRASHLRECRCQSHRDNDGEQEWAAIRKSQLRRPQ